MSKIIILDGGMSRELMRLNAPFRQPEWSALALMEAPQLVEQVHVEFAAAGAQVLTTDSYALVPFHIGEERFLQHGEKLAADAGRLARKAADTAGQVVVAGSLPPLFGSYEPDKFQPGIAPAYIDILVRGLSPFVDVWLGETLSLIAEAEVVVTATKKSTKPVWIAFTLDESDDGPPSLRSGELVKEAARWALHSGVKALLFNCCRPEVIDAAVRVAKEVVSENVRIGAYANSFEPKPKMHQANEVVSGIREDLNPAQYGEYAKRWTESGASILMPEATLPVAPSFFVTTAAKNRKSPVAKESPLQSSRSRSLTPRRSRPPTTTHGNQRSPAATPTGITTLDPANPMSPPRSTKSENPDATLSTTALQQWRNDRLTINARSRPSPCARVLEPPTNAQHGRLDSALRTRHIPATNWTIDEMGKVLCDLGAICTTILGNLYIRRWRIEGSVAEVSFGDVLRWETLLDGSSGRTYSMDLLEGPNTNTSIDTPNRAPPCPYTTTSLTPHEQSGTGANTTRSNDRWMASAVKSRGSETCAGWAYIGEAKRRVRF
ncbi:hypothetical protein Q7P35_008784 [Cladosporium inversicolor]